MIIREYCEELNTSKLGKFDEMGKFLERQTTETDSRRYRNANNEIELVIKGYLQ